MFKEHIFDWRIALRSIFTIIFAVLVFTGMDYVIVDVLQWTTTKTPILAVILGMWSILPFSRSWARDLIETYSKALERE